MSKNYFFKGILILTFTGILSRLMGFFYKIFLSHAIGAQGLGIYQLTLPVHGIVLAGASLGIQAAISRLCASSLALGKEKDACNTLLIGIVFSTALSFLLSAAVFGNADFLGTVVLKEPETADLLRILAFSFPLSSLHSCINSFYFARKKAGIPSGIQLLEQTARISSAYVIYLIFLSEGRKITPVIAAGGALFSEVAAASASLLALAFYFQKIRYRFVKNSFSLSLVREIKRIAVPHSVNRLLLTTLSGIEMVLIPRRLLLAGLSQADALSIYGIFTGMALPLILFPATLTNSASLMLMPSVASLQALGQEKRIRFVLRKTMETCFLFGSCCTFFFFLFGNLLGKFLFHSSTAGIYIRTLAFICPFLYTNTMLESILNGLGKPDACLFHNAAGICIRIAFIFFFIPVLGIQGYFYGMLLSQLILTFLHFIYLNNLTSVS